MPDQRHLAGHRTEMLAQWAALLRLQQDCVQSDVSPRPLITEAPAVLKEHALGCRLEQARQQQAVTTIAGAERKFLARQP